MKDLAKTTHFNCEIADGIARISLNRPERKNPLTFDSYAELRDWFRDLAYAEDIHAVVFLPNGGNFSSGGDVHDIIGPLTRMNMKELMVITLILFIPISLCHIEPKIQMRLIFRIIPQFRHMITSEPQDLQGFLGRFCSGSTETCTDYLKGHRT